jgi:hypothetical protein
MPTWTVYLVFDIPFFVSVLSTTSYGLLGLPPPGKSQFDIIGRLLCEPSM